jgi:hypothetical protein
MSLITRGSLPCVVCTSGTCKLPDGPGLATPPAVSTSAAAAAPCSHTCQLSRYRCNVRHSPWIQCQCFAALVRHTSMRSVKSRHLWQLAVELRQLPCHRCLHCDVFDAVACTDHTFASARVCQPDEQQTSRQSMFSTSRLATPSKGPCALGITNRAPSRDPPSVAAAMCGLTGPCHANIVCACAEGLLKLLLCRQESLFVR